jgi:hypothetical protein
MRNEKKQRKAVEAINNQFSLDAWRLSGAQ